MMVRFFGLRMKPGIKYNCTVPKAFCVNCVALEEGDYAKLYAISQEGTFVVATLTKGIPQVKMDMRFGRKERVAFTAKGNATICLTGLLDDTKYGDEDSAEYKRDTDDDDEEGGFIGGFNGFNGFAHRVETVVAFQNIGNENDYEVMTREYSQASGSKAMVKEKPKTDAAAAKKGDRRFSGVAKKQNQEVMKLLLETFSKKNDSPLTGLVKKKKEEKEKKQGELIEFEAIEDQSKEKYPKVKKQKRLRERTETEDKENNSEEKSPKPKKQKRAAKLTLSEDKENKSPKLKKQKRRRLERIIDSDDDF